MLGARFRQRGRLQEGPDLLTERLVLTGRHSTLAAVPERFTSQGDLESLPGSLVRPLEGSRQPLAVVGEVVGEDADNRLQAAAYADGLERPANDLTKGKGGQIL